MVADDQLVVRAVAARRLVVVSNIAVAFRECRSATTRVASGKSRHTESAGQEAGTRGRGDPSQNRHTIFRVRARISPWTSRPRQYDASLAKGRVPLRPGERASRAPVVRKPGRTARARLPSA